MRASFVQMLPFLLSRTFFFFALKFLTVSEDSTLELMIWYSAYTHDRSNQGRTEDLPALTDS